MKNGLQVFHNARIFDGETLWQDRVAIFEDGCFQRLAAAKTLPRDAAMINLGGDILCPGYVDLQVNGGGGVMLNAAPTVATLRRMAAAHRALGVRHFLPTLITDTLETTRAAIAAVRAAVAEGLPGIAGLHLEGPHLSVARKGAHDPALIRPMTPEDMAMLAQAARDLPCLLLTVAPENVRPDQVTALAAAGARISLGHSDADFATCQRYFAAGATLATHLFNAMSPITSRAPGLVGAALATGPVSAGVIADGVHVHPETLRLAWDAKRGPGQIFLVSDAMAVAGSTMTAFTLNGRQITRKAGQLRLADGTLAGADLDLTTALRVLVTQAGIDLAPALAAATRVPAQIAGLHDYGLKPGQTRLPDVIRIRADLSGLAPLRETAAA